MATRGPGTAFGEALRKALDGRKVPWLEGATGISRGRLHRLIMGRGEVTLTEAAAIASALNVPVETFLPPAEPVVEPEEAETSIPFVSVPPHVLETKATTASAS